MHFFHSVVSALALAGLALGEKTTESSSSATSSSSSGKVKVQVVKVSNKEGNLTFTPDSITAEAGSMVQFHFYPSNHSVVQATFDEPCVPINNVNKSVTGFYSGFMPTTLSAKTTPVYTLMINDTKPIWFYCSQATHCQAGMVGAINVDPSANKTRTLANFKELAAKASENLSPGQSSTSSSSSSSSSGSSSSGSSSGTSSSNSSSTSGNSSSSATGAASTGGAGSLSGGLKYVSGAGIACFVVALVSAWL
ncbi:MAG: hypothetical protein M1834_000183 [Cirrosporium novae-zelandiae]|nr:MAG: hypothetical protein M1834_000183 [Cirrosporium novae-zelandiae]